MRGIFDLVLMVSRRRFVVGPKRMEWPFGSERLNTPVSSMCMLHRPIYSQSIVTVHICEIDRLIDTFAHLHTLHHWIVSLCIEVLHGLED